MLLSRSTLIAASLAFILPATVFAQGAAPATGASNNTAPAAAAAPAAATPTAPAAAATTGAPLSRADVQALVKETLLNDPQIIMDAMGKLREKQEQEEAKLQKEGLEKHKSDVYNDSYSPVAGDKSGNVTLVEFFDYHCGYCKRLLPELTKLMSEDKNVQVVFKEFPILTADSVDASKAALAVYHIAPEKYFAFHTAMMQSTGKFDDKALAKFAKEQGISGEKLKAEMAKPYITAELDKNRDLGKDMGVHGTPAVIVGDTFLPGAVSYEELKKAVDEARNGKKADDAAKLAPSAQN